MTLRPGLKEELVSLELAEKGEEASIRSRMLELLERAPECFLRSCFPGHFTGSALVLSADRKQTLLHHHRKLDRWLQFGGHCDGESDVRAVALREAEEESGIESLAVLNSQPFDLDIHKITARGDEPEHWHYDVRYALIAPADATFRQSSESKELRWFTPEEMEALPLDAGLRRLVAKWRRVITSRS